MRQCGGKDANCAVETVGSSSGRLLLVLLSFLPARMAVVVLGAAAAPAASRGFSRTAERGCHCDPPPTTALLLVYLR